MNIPAAIISAAFGAALFAGMNAFQHRSYPIMPDSLGKIFATKHSRARTAVTRLLIDPASAEFSALRSVEADAAEYVCGIVRARDRSGRYAGYRAFVYAVAVDVARIDDNGRIAHRHDVFRTCPVSEEEGDSLRQKLVTPGAAAMVEALQTIMPGAGDPSTQPAGGPGMLAGAVKSGGAVKSSGGTLEQQVGQMASQLSAGYQPGTVGQQNANSTFKAASRQEHESRGDQPPAAWPTFPSDHPLAKPARKRTTEQAMALAKDVEDRWERFNSGAANSRPSPDEIKDACRALLAIDPKDDAYPKAWAAFVRLRRIDRAAL
jgi:hypothetical protein